MVQHDAYYICAAASLDTKIVF